MKVVNISHKYPFIEQLMSNLRDITIQKNTIKFQKSVYALGQILGIELSCYLNYINEDIITPFGSASCKRLTHWPTIVPILRAGRALQEGISSILIDSEVVDCDCPKYINGQRNANINLEQINPNNACIICDPMIAGGKSLISTIKVLKAHCPNIYVLSCIASNYALPLLQEILPDESILLTCAIDDFTPNVRGTRPGLGDVGDLLYGTKKYKLKMNTLYDSLNEGIKHIPENVNVKMIFRHSFRDSFVKEKDYQIITLNEYGILKAKELGNNIAYPIGGLYSSKLDRCVQTLEYMTDNKEIIVAPDYLTTVFTYDNETADAQIKLLGSLKKVIIELKQGKTIPGFYPINATVKKIIDFVFTTGNKKHSIDLYCTHDFHIGMMLAIMFDEIETVEDLTTNWPNMLEGMLLYGTREAFFCIWRGKIRYFTNYLM